MHRTFCHWRLTELSGAWGPDRAPRRHAAHRWHNRATGSAHSRRQGKRGPFPRLRVRPPPPAIAKSKSYGGSAIITSLMKTPAEIPVAREPKAEASQSKPAFAMSDEGRAIHHVQFAPSLIARNEVHNDQRTAGFCGSFCSMSQRACRRVGEIHGHQMRRGLTRRDDFVWMFSFSCCSYLRGSLGRRNNGN